MGESRRRAWNSTDIVQSCTVCGNLSSKQCSICSVTPYCNKVRPMNLPPCSLSLSRLRLTFSSLNPLQECQTQDWKAKHKNECSKIKSVYQQMKSWNEFDWERYDVHRGFRGAKTFFACPRVEMTDYFTDFVWVVSGYSRGVSSMVLKIRSFSFFLESFVWKRNKLIHKIGFGSFFVVRVGRYKYLEQEFSWPITTKMHFNASGTSIQLHHWYYISFYSAVRHFDWTGTQAVLTSW